MVRARFFPVSAQICRDPAATRSIASSGRIWSSATTQRMSGCVPVEFHAAVIGVQRERLHRSSGSLSELIA
jgi:hypothetical protein